MQTAFQSTFRRCSRAISLSCSCLFIGFFGACSGQNKNDWFHFGKDEPAVDAQPESETAALPDQESPVWGSQEPPVEQASPEPVPVAQIEPEPEPEPVVVQDTPPAMQPESGIQEVILLYRRLHAEMNLAGRSQVIVELLNDPRERVRLLGFDLASRDLSSGATLSTEVANTAISNLSDPLPSIRSGSARLITRLALPDAMTLLTGALHSEDDPTVAEALLRGIERWPNIEAQEDVLRWYESDGTVKAAAANAAWALADLQLWDLDSHASTLRSIYQTIDNDGLTNADMRLIATTGTSSDIERLITLARDTEFAQRSNAANALVYTPRGVDLLINLAKENPAFCHAAAESIERHRLNPNGVRLLAALPWQDDQSRVDSIVRICNQLDHDQLADAVRLIRTDQTINDDLTIRLLNPLIIGPTSISPRSAPGVVLLAELELNKQRPDRALEVLSLLPDSGIDPATSQRASRAASKAHILLEEFDQAAELDLSSETWLGVIAMLTDPAAKARVAVQIQNRLITLTKSEAAFVSKLANAQPETPDPLPTEQP